MRWVNHEKVVTTINVSGLESENCLKMRNDESDISRRWCLICLLEDCGPSLMFFLQLVVAGLAPEAWRCWLQLGLALGQFLVGEPSFQRFDWLALLAHPRLRRSYSFLLEHCVPSLMLSLVRALRIPLKILFKNLNCLSVNGDESTELNKNTKYFYLSN